MPQSILLVLALLAPAEEHFQVMEDPERIRIFGSALEASIRKKGYVTGVEAQSLLDRKTGFRERGFGLDIVDWIMEPGSDEAYRERLPGFYGGKKRRQARDSRIEHMRTDSRRLQGA